MRIYYDRRRHYFACCQVTRLDPTSGHQTQILTSRRSLETAEVATTMFARWREENLFRFMRPRGLDAMAGYAKTEDDPGRMIPNPAKTQMKKRIAAARAALAAAKQAAFAAGEDGKAGSVTQAEVALAELKARSKTIPAKVALGEVRPTAMRLNDERKRLHDAVRMATWNAEHALAAALGAHYARAEDEAHSLLAEAFYA